MTKKTDTGKAMGRRSFLKSGAKMLPAVAVMGLTLLAVSQPASACGGCSGTCSGACDGTCYGRCVGTCSGGCDGTCSGLCAGTCSGRY